MSVIFQLFSADDLKGLASSQLLELRNKVRDIKEGSEVRKKLKERADVVFCQLKGWDQQLLPEPEPPDPLQPLAYQLIKVAGYLDTLDQKELKILEWAIECERDSSAYVLKAVSDEVYPWFQRQPGKLSNATLPTPDTEYSPFSKNYEAYRVKTPHEKGRPGDLTMDERRWDDLPPQAKAAP